MKLNEKKSAKKQKDKRKHSKVLRALACTSLAALLLVFACIPAFAMSSTVIGDADDPYIRHWASPLPIKSIYSSLYAEDTGLDPYDMQPGFYSDFENDVYASPTDIITTAINQESRFIVNKHSPNYVRSFVNRVQWSKASQRIINAVYFGDSSYRQVPGYYGTGDLASYHLGFVFDPFTFNSSRYATYKDTITIRYARSVSLGNYRVGVPVRYSYTVLASDNRREFIEEEYTLAFGDDYINNDSSQPIYTLNIKLADLLPPRPEADDNLVIEDLSIFIGNDFHGASYVDPVEYEIKLSSITYSYYPQEYALTGIEVDKLPYGDVDYPTYLSNDFNLLSWVRNVLNEIFELPIFTTPSGLTVITLGTVVGTVVTIVFAVVILKMFYGG